MVLLRVVSDLQLVVGFLGMRMLKFRLRSICITPPPLKPSFMT
ncbi:hypothetical protein MtrunA17_Chr5g0416791 [Medicago truncatula]|uniref:Uncharacterized protein n=1 Tax=Medicago truncatula TaxID=3880 RepID=A0A396HTR7_MEDTR|nr:hypothetical protein MtrunA17_Chr5g0416791 [Medicago truncatula]